MKYQLESSHIADYQLYSLPGIDFPLRGPPVAIGGDAPMIAYLGAAQVFGAFVNHPFPSLLGEMTATRTLNLGNGGAGPGLYAPKSALLDYVNGAALCVLQVMSARSSVQNRYMQALNGRASVRLRRPDGSETEILGHHAFAEMADLLTPVEFSALVNETLENYVAQYEALTAQINIPTVLLYLGKSPPIDPGAGGKSWQSQHLIGTHPHLVTAPILERLSALTDETVVIHGNEGFDARLLNRFTGRYTAIERSATYTVARHSAYISPHMHVRTALELYPVAQRLLGQAKSKSGAGA